MASLLRMIGKECQVAAGPTVLDVRPPPKTKSAAGIVVSAPMATSVMPTARRVLRGNLPAASKPMPAPSMARVPTMKKNCGFVRSTLFMMASGKPRCCNPPATGAAVPARAAMMIA